MASWKSLKRTIKKGPNGPFNYCVCSSSVTGQRRNIMIDQIRAIDNKRLLKKVGKLPNDLSTKVKENIAIILDLD